MLAAFGGGGFNMAVAVLLLAWLGSRLDGWLGTAPWLMAAGIVFGAISGFVGIYEIILRMGKEGLEPPPGGWNDYDSDEHKDRD